jgi:hypothetical protein
MIIKPEIKYKEFTVYPDNYFGYSLYDRNGKWCQSATNIESLKGSVECILLADIELTPNEYWKRKNAILKKYNLISCNN